jgi:hypothetical protein
MLVAHDAPGRDGVKEHYGVGGAPCQYSVVGQFEIDTPLARVDHPHAGMGGSVEEEREHAREWLIEPGDQP